MRLWVGLFAAAILATVAPAVNAQEQSPAPSPSEPAQNIPEQKLDAVAKALDQVASLKEDYQKRFEAAEPADKQRIVQEANDAMVKAVTDQGLSVQEYTAILVVARNDTGVRDKILQRLRPPNQ